MKPILPLLALIAAATGASAAEPATPPSNPQPPKESLAPGGLWKHGDMNRPRPRVITPPGLSTQAAPGQPPSDAIILFDGTDLSKWKREKAAPGLDDSAQWKVENGYFEVVPKTGYLRTREKFQGDTQWHIEWAAPSVVQGRSQGRGNSGVFIGGFPELQVLDSFENDTYPDGQAGALYGQYPPMVNASRRPGEWQSYDIVIERPQRDAGGKIVRKARISVIYNGIIVQWQREIEGGAEEGDLALQDHGNPVRYRNIWVRPINLTNPDREGTPPPGAPAPATAAAPAPAKPASPAIAAEAIHSVTIKTLHAQMRYDTTDFEVKPEEKVKLVFQNDDDMPHNLCFFQPGTDVVAASNKQMEKPEEALKRNWIPEDPRMWLHSKLVNPKEHEELSFSAPEKPGVYPYVCTFPGHAAIMQGRMTVGEVGTPLPGLASLKFQLYLGAWKSLPNFSELTPHREGEVPDHLVQLKLDDYKNDYGLVFTGKIEAPKDSEYTFLLASDDGGRIFIDGKQAVDNDGMHPSTTIREGKVRLTKGPHDFRLEYFQAQGGQDLFVAWRTPGFAGTALSKWVHPEFKTSGPSKKADETTGMPLVVGQEPIVYRNFISGGGNRGIGVGYPGNASIAWSAEYFGPVIAWRGAFIDAARHWKGRGGGHQLPLGFDVIRPAGERALPFAVNPASDAPWPTLEKGERAPDYAWKGYELDARRYPTFHYEWKDAKVSEHFEVVGDAFTGNGRLVRSLKIESPIPAGAMLRVATGEIRPAQGGFDVIGEKLSLDGHSFDNVFHVAVEGGTIVGRNLVLPVRPKTEISYSWPDSHAHHNPAP